MIYIFAPILALIGAAIVFRGREARGLIVMAAAFAADTITFSAAERWGWAAFTAAWMLACFVAIKLAKREA